MMPTTQPTKPRPANDGRLESLPHPAVNLAQRLAQLANAGEFIVGQIIIVDGVWYLLVDGRSERMGKG